MTNVFTFNAKKFLLTYSQCPLDKEEVLTFLQILGTVSWYTVSRELHADGQPHIHACVHFSKKHHSTRANYFDLSGYHPNIEQLKLAADFERAEAYCRKHGDFISNCETKVPKRVALAKRLIEHGRLDREFITENPEIIFTNFSSIQSYLSLLGTKKLKVSYPTSKKRHYWIHGPSNTGKTTFLRSFIQEKYSVEIPTNDDYRCDDETEVLYADEFKGHLTVQQLNKLCDGHCQLNKKGGSVHIMFPTVFIISNYSIRDCYSKVSDDIYETLCNRFNEYDVSIAFPSI